MSELGRLVAANAENKVGSPHRVEMAAHIGNGVAQLAADELRRYSRGEVQVTPEMAAATVTHSEVQYA